VLACFITFLLLRFGDDCDQEIWPDIPVPDSGSTVMFIQLMHSQYGINIT